MWSEWIHEGAPPVGAYIQVECHHKVTNELRRFEGLISHYNGTIAVFVNDPDPTGGENWMAERWRFRRSDAYQDLCKAMELVAV